MRPLGPRLFPVPAAIEFRPVSSGGETTVSLVSAIALIPMAGLRGHAAEEAARSIQREWIVAVDLRGPDLGPDLVNSESNWLGSAQLLTLYAMIGITFFFVG